MELPETRIRLTLSERRRPPGISRGAAVSRVVLACGVAVIFVALQTSFGATDFRGRPGNSATRSTPGVVLDSPSFYATFVGGSSGSWAVAPVIAPDGDIIVAGFTSSPNFPTTPGALDRTFAAPADAFIARLDSTGSNLVYSTFLGGTGSDRAWGIALDSEGSVYVTGDTTSTDFPTTPGALSRTLSGGPSDAFVSKLSPDGGTLQYSKYLGGGGADLGAALTVDPTGSAFIVGTT